MSNAPFAPCPACARHVRVDAAACPFCASDLARAAFDPVPDAGGRRLGRAALFAFATTVAAAGCPSPQRPDTGNNNNIVQPYGAPPNPPPRPGDAGAVAAPPDPGLVVAIYGAPMPPPPDAAADAASPDAAADAPAPDVAARPDARPPRPPRPGPPMVRYGAPPPPDPCEAA